ncbi:tail fiber protein [Vibrio phage PJN101]|nr:tail fiber protein [Vibrio phage PJN101]
MGLKSTFNKDKSKAEACAVGKYVNTAYDNMVIISKNIDALLEISETLVYLTTYLGPYESDPTERPNGSPLQDGDYYFNTLDNALKYYDMAEDNWFGVDPQEILDARDAAQAAQAGAETAEANALVSANNAATSETNASNSEVAALASEQAAATSEANALASENAAAQSETNAAASESAAATSAANALASENASVASETAAAQSESNAATSESNAATSASEAATSETNAGASEDAAANSAVIAAGYAADAEAAFDNFTDLYLGAKATDPITDNDGNSLQVGATYWNTTSNDLRYWSGATWDIPEQTAIQAANDAVAARDDAQVSETNAANSASAASTSESNAAQSASDALASENAASTSESNAATSESNAATSASSAAASENNAAQSAVDAQQSADDTAAIVPSLQSQIEDRVTYPDLTTAQGDVLGGKLIKGSNSETVENGDEIPAGTTHLRVLVGGKPTIVAMSPIASGIVNSLTDKGAVIGGDDVSFTRHLEVSTVFDLMNHPLISEGFTVETEGYYTPGDGGGNTYEIVAPGTGVEDGGSFINLTGSGFQAKGIFEGHDVDIRQFGVLRNGEKDTNAFKAALTFCFSNNKNLDVSVDIHVTDVTINSGVGSVTCSNGVIIAHPDSDQSDVYGSELLTFGAGVSGSEFYLKIDLNGLPKSGVALEGEGNKSDLIYVSNGVVTQPRTRNIWGARISNDRNIVGTVKTEGFSFYEDPMVGVYSVVVDNHCQDTEIQRIISNGSAAILNNGKRTNVGYVRSEKSEDNAVYEIEGAEELHIGTLVVSECSDEVLVLSKNKLARIDTIIATNCARGIGIAETDNSSVGTLIWNSELGSIQDSGSPLYFRPTQVGRTSSFTIDHMIINGKWDNGAPIYTLDNGEIGTLTIGKITANLVYSNVNATKYLGFWSANTDRIQIGDINVTVTDETGTLSSSDTFLLTLPGLLSLPSNIGGITLSNGGGSHNVRAINITEPNLVISNTPTVRADIGTPFIPQNDTQQTTRFYGSGAVPTNGTWKKGDTVWNQFPTAGGHLGWVCVTGGTPGAWKKFGDIEP